MRNHPGGQVRHTAALQVPVRASAVSLALSGLMVGALLPLHPSIFDRPVSEVVRGDAMWIPLHLVAIVVFVLAFIGAAGLVAVHGGTLSRLGRTGLVVTLIGVVAGSGLAALEAIAFPVLAVRAPELLALDGPILASPLFIGLGLCALGWAVGLAMLGAAAARAGVFTRTPGILLAVSAPIFLALGGGFVPFAGILSGLIFGAAQMWWGWLIWRSTPRPPAVPT